MNSYTERSVSGTGIRIFVRAPEQEAARHGDAELYSRDRFFTVTGHHVPGTPIAVESREEEFAALSAEIEARRDAGRPARAPSQSSGSAQGLGVTALGIPDDEIIRVASETCEGFADFWNGGWGWYSDDRSQADMKFIGQLAFYCGPGEEQRVFDLAMASGMVREKWENRPEYLTELTIPRAYEGRDEYYAWSPQLGSLGRPRGTAGAQGAATHEGESDESSSGTVVAVAMERSAGNAPGHEGEDDEPTSKPPKDKLGRPTVIMNAETDRILLELEKLLSSKIFQRGNQLVIVEAVDTSSKSSRIRRSREGYVVHTLTLEQLQRHMSRMVHFVQAENRQVDGKQKRVYKKIAAPRNLAGLLLKCQQWSHLPVLEGITTSPFMRPDGSLVTTPGYDAATGYLFLDDGTPWEAVPEQPTPEEVASAVATIEDVIVDFPFKDPAARAAWIAQLLTAVGREAIVGPVPMLVNDANQLGTGKTTLGRAIGWITLGHDPTEVSFTADEKELENRLASILAAGDRYAVFDNCTGSIRNPVLDRFLTGGRFDFRRFFKQENAKLPNNVTLALTGNNVTLRGDLPRRVIRCRLVTQDERPEARSDFRHPDLKEYVLRNRPKIFAAALTILRAHAAAGFEPCLIRVVSEDGTVREVPARPVGSFNDWDRVVRHAVLRAGLPDPISTQDEAREENEDDINLLAFLKAWHAWNENFEGTATGLVSRLYSPSGLGSLSRIEELELNEAMIELTGGEVGRCPNPKQLAYRLKDARDKWIHGYRLVRVKRTNAGIKYRVETDPAIVPPLLGGV